MIFQDFKEVKKMKTAELEVVLKAYADCGVVLPEDGFENNGERVEFIRMTMEERGVPHIVSEKDIELNPNAGLNLGEMVILPLLNSGLTVSGEKSGEPYKADGSTPPVPPDTTTPPTPPETPPATPGDEQGPKGDEGAGGGPKTAPEAVSKVSRGTRTSGSQLGALSREDIILKNGLLVHEGQVITAIRNRAANGRLFKELVCPTSTFTVTVEQFDEIMGNIAV